MNASAVIFYAISAFILGAALLSVTSRRIFRSAIWLLFSLIGVAGLYFWMEMEFVAAVQTIVYVGGIVVLIIFSIFLTQQSGGKLQKPPVKRAVFAGLAAVSGLVLTWNLVHQYGFRQVNVKPVAVNVADIGEQMLSTTRYGYVLPFELISILLLAAMVGCIVIAMKTPEKKVEVNIQTGNGKPGPHDIPVQGLTIEKVTATETKKEEVI